MSQRHVAKNSRFIKSGRSANNGACVEVAVVDSIVLVRDSKDSSGPVLQFDAREWTAFVGGVLDGDFDHTIDLVSNEQSGRHGLADKLR